MIQYIIYRLTLLLEEILTNVSPCHTMKARLTYYYTDKFTHLALSPKRITSGCGLSALKIRAPPQIKGVSDKFKNFEKFTLCSKTQ